MDIDFESVKIDDLSIVSTLGCGTYGKVELVRIKNYPKRSFALKSIRMKSLRRKLIDNVLREKYILLSSTCPFIVFVYKSFHSKNRLHFLMESCLGGDMWHILERYGSLKPKAVKFYTGCVVEALDYLHSHHIVYRDLKPENLLVNNQGYLKLTDFGLCTILSDENSMANTYCGTFEYIAPEVIKGKEYDYSVDYWALGVLVYELLTGCPMFKSDTSCGIQYLILKGVKNVMFPNWFSKSVRNFIKQLCSFKPEYRLGYRNRNMDEIRNHNWFWNFNWEDLQSQSLKPPLIPRISNEFDITNFSNISKTHNSYNNEVENYFEGFDYP